MRRTLALSAGLFAACALSACTTPTRYAAAAGPGGVGWTETQVEGDRWRVSFTAAGGATPARALDLALLRAAELTTAQGGRWLTLYGRAGEPTDPRWGRFGAWIGEDPGYATTLEFTIWRGEAQPNVTSLDAKQTADALRTDIENGREPLLPRFIGLPGLRPRG